MAAQNNFSLIDPTNMASDRSALDPSLQNISDNLRTLLADTSEELPLVVSSAVEESTNGPDTSDRFCGAARAITAVMKRLANVVSAVRSETFIDILQNQTVDQLCADILHPTAWNRIVQWLFMFVAGSVPSNDGNRWNRVTGVSGPPSQYSDSMGSDLVSGHYLQQPIWEIEDPVLTFDTRKLIAGVL